MQTLTANIVYIEEKKIRKGTLTMSGGKIVSLIDEGEEESALPYVLPGFIDSHVHIESSLLVPSEFARLAVVHGTVGTISDPHEIANVCGIKGVEYMIENSRTVPFKFHFGAPSCVPATTFETAGARLGIDEVETLLNSPDIFYLSEMMNFPGVLNRDEEVMQKIAAARQAGKPVDGHAPGLRGQDAQKYIEAGISTDHECFTIEEALNKLEFGMKILIREGSAAKNFDALIPLLKDHAENIMFCSDDKHPDSLLEGHINQLCARAVAAGYDVFKVLLAACINPVRHYNMNIGLMQEGDPADFIVVKDLRAFEVLATFIGGTKVAEYGKSLLTPLKTGIINHFSCEPVSAEDLIVEGRIGQKVPVIVALDGQLITLREEVSLPAHNNNLQSDLQQDIIKIVVYNRYSQAKPAVAFVKNFGIRNGAIAGSIAHDSHNIIAAGVTDEDLCRAINLVVEAKGGIACVGDKNQMIIPLPVAGLMSNEDGYRIAQDYIAIDKMAKEELGSTLASPFMTLSFMALLVIPSLKLSDKGLFDGDLFRLIND